VARAYTSRFIQSGPLPGASSYTVPSGYRAIVRNILGFAEGAVTGGRGYQIQLRGNWVYSNVDQASLYRWKDEVRIVAYGGEVIGLTTYGDSAYALVTGYLFSESAAGDLALGEQRESEGEPLEAGRAASSTLVAP